MMKQQDLIDSLLRGDRKLRIKRNDILEEMQKPTCPLNKNEKVKLVAYLRNTAPRANPVFEVIH